MTAAQLENFLARARKAQAELDKLLGELERGLHPSQAPAPASSSRPADPAPDESQR